MKHFSEIRRRTGKTVMIILAMGLLTAISASGATAGSSGKPAAEQKELPPGERMYRQGVLPSGEPLQAFGKDDTQTPGTSFACISCHLRSGLGSVEGGVNTTPANLITLYRSRDKAGTGNNRRNATMGMGVQAKNAQTVIQPPPARPAYSDETLAEVLRSGRDPSGRMLDPVMPRYNLNDKDAASLIAYLKTLSAGYSPGVDKYSINFATVITAEVPKEQVEAMLLPIESFVKNANSQQAQLEQLQVKLLEFPKEVTYRQVKHFRWLLKGDPATWRDQLEEYYRKEPVFALIGGVTTQDWQPVHQFSETHGIPCILPSTDLPVVSDNELYTLYFSKGLYQEGEAAAHYLQTANSTAKPLKTVQIVSTNARGKALSDGFLAGIHNDATITTTTILRDPIEPLTQNFIQQILDREKPDVLALWTETGSITALASIPKIASSGLRLIVSASYPGSSIMTIPEQLRDMTYITYPYRLPQDEKRFARFTDQKLSPDAQRVQSRAYAMLLVLTQALRELKGDFYRDYLLDVISMRPDITPALYERLSFAPEQRYVSKGGYIVQVSKGTSPELVRKSDWGTQ